MTKVVLNILPADKYHANSNLPGSDLNPKMSFNAIRATVNGSFAEF